MKEIKDDKNKLDKVKNVADNKTSNLESSPLAMGLNFLTGWSLSLFISKKSLIKYIAEEIRQKEIKASDVFDIACLLKSNENMIAENTSKFFVHCLGLIDFIKE